MNPLLLTLGVCVALCLFSLFSLHGQGRLGTNKKADSPDSSSQPTSGLQSHLLQAEQFVAKLEQDLKRVESGLGWGSAATAVTASTVNSLLPTSQPGDRDQGGLPIFSSSSSSRAQLGQKALRSSPTRSMIDITVRSNASNYEILPARPPGEGGGVSSGSEFTSGAVGRGGISSSNSGSGSGSGSDEDTVRWETQLTRKLRCLSSHRGGIFLYHVRKAAGTSVKDVLHHSSKLWRVPVFETEGLSLDPRFLVPKSLLSVLTMRDPVDRALSMYWYEHVGWYDGILHQPQRCKTLREWVEAWRDGSVWKKKFVSSNPRSVYVEIENYYVKMLTGWTGAEVIGESHLEQAKIVLKHFDVVLVMEWMQDARQIDAMNAIFPGRTVVAAKHMLRGDKKAKERLQAQLAPDEQKMRDEIAKFNKYDILLWDFAQSLLARRLRVLQGIATSAHKAGPFTEEKTAHAECGAHSHSAHGRLERDLTSQLGIFRPPGHKGPF